MSSRRAQIAMDAAEQAALLEDERVVVVASNGPDGWPHLMPLWYVLRAGEVWGWTFAKSQKVRNMRRDPKVTLQVEAGEAYDQLRGVMYKAQVVLHEDLDTITGIGTELLERYGGGALDEGARAAIRQQASKRIGLQFVVSDAATWDHRKLGGVY